MTPSTLIAPNSSKIPPTNSRTKRAPSDPLLCPTASRASLRVFGVHPVSEEGNCNPWTRLSLERLMHSRESATWLCGLEQGNAAGLWEKAGPRSALLMGDAQVHPPLVATSVPAALQDCTIQASSLLSTPPQFFPEPDKQNHEAMQAQVGSFKSSNSSCGVRHYCRFRTLSNGRGR